ncbi:MULTISPECIES: dihydrolipoyl dehydrogenase [unclassified Neochlamydia]|uniref:dihydrolipoyl dehydrogenase n=1 Tax=unclassified Neochlamydia TaxID=2643326 RepID=UPI001BCA1363|nr:MULTISPECIES: dihydrolipoyl dehydrogenase [unclassified Neochlamydia]MBS4166399.1 Dihydrolipoyl dehydrogenase, mitochondrial [Neochlamydia sp. AcF65]MBS4169353.1 Dihydrolipoyl dehydrogenase, mitochondrial [Neochlamydia sp. AcF95]
MITQQFDVVVIGAGPGGYVAAIRAAQLGMKVACIEKAQSLGGTCLNVGCIPSKTLLQSTRYWEWLVKESKDLGIEANEIKVNFETMMQRKAKVVFSLTEGIRGLFKKNKVESIRGIATFVDPYVVEVTNNGRIERIKGNYFILATGSEAVGLPFLAFDEKKIISSTGALSLEKVPKQMAVIGAGAIGVEMASIYRRLGTQVHVIEKAEEICLAMDPTIRKHLLRGLKQQGIEFHLAAQVQSAKYEREGVTVEFEEGGERKNLHSDLLLVAVGRKPHTDGLGLEQIDVKKSNRGTLNIDNFFRTSLPHIFAIGDIVDGPMLAHKASDEGMAVAEIIAGMAAYVNYMALPHVVYTHPEAAAVGLNETEAREAGLEVMVGTAFFKGNARARCMGESEGIVKIIGDKKSERVVGLHILGSHASEMIEEGALAIQKKATLENIARLSHSHPTLTESIKEAAMDALGYAMH